MTQSSDLFDFIKSSIKERCLLSDTQSAELETIIYEAKEYFNGEHFYISLDDGYRDTRRVLLSKDYNDMLRNLRHKYKLKSNDAVLKEIRGNRKIKRS